jgi:hypothetical protein
VAIGEGHTDSVGAVALSQRNSSFISKQGNNTSISIYINLILIISFSKGFLISGGNDKTMKRWQLPLHDLVNLPKGISISIPISISHTNITIYL